MMRVRVLGDVGCGCWTVGGYEARGDGGRRMIRGGFGDGEGGWRGRGIEGSWCW